MKNKFKAVIFILVLLVLSITLISCDKNFIKLTLPEGVEANVTNLDKIKKNTDITLTIITPTGMELEYLKVNTTNVEVVENKYIFKITEDTIVEVKFKELQTEIETFSLSIPSGISVNVPSLTAIMKNTQITLTVTPPEGKELKSLKLNSVAVAVTNNTYTFSITENTVVTIEFKNIDTSEETFSLTLPEGVTANVDDTSSIEAGTTVTLTITSPEGKEIDFLKVNSNQVVVTVNKYAFVITENTVVEVAFKDIIDLNSWVQLNKSEMISFLNSLNLEFYHEGNLRLLMESLNDGEETTLIFYSNFDAKLGISKLFIDYVGNEDSVKVISNENYIYQKIRKLDGLSINQEEAKILTKNENFLEMISPLYGDVFWGLSKVLPTGPKSFNDLVNESIRYGLRDLSLDSELLNLLEISQKDNQTKVVLELDQSKYEEVLKNFLIGVSLIDLFDANEIFKNRDFSITFEILFENDKFISLNAQGDLDRDGFLDLSIEYVDIDFVLDQEFYIFDKTRLEYYTYNIFFEETPTQIKFDKSLVDSLFGFGNTESAIEKAMNLFKPYKKGFALEGLYKDSLFTNEMEAEDLKTNNLNIYIKWVPEVSLQTRINNILSSGNLVIKNVDSNYIIVESSKYVIVPDGLNTYIYSKQNNKYYLADNSNLSNIKVYELTTLEFSLSSLLDILNNFEANNLFVFKDFIIDFEASLGFKNDQLMILNTMNNGFVSGMYEKSELEMYLDYMLMNADILVNNATMDALNYVNPIEEEKFVDVQGIEDNFLFDSFYNSGHVDKFSLRELKALGFLDYILPNEANGYKLYLVYGVDAVEVTGYFFYDSEVDQIAVFEGTYRYYYLKDLYSLPMLFPTLTKTFKNWSFEGVIDVFSVEDIPGLNSNKKVLRFTPIYELKDLAVIYGSLSSYFAAESYLDNYHLELFIATKTLKVQSLVNEKYFYLQATGGTFTIRDNDRLFSFPILKMDYESLGETIISIYMEDPSLYGKIEDLIKIIKFYMGYSASVEKYSNGFLLDSGLELNFEGNSFIFVGDSEFTFNLVLSGDVETINNSFDNTYTIYNNASSHPIITALNNPYKNLLATNLANFRFKGYQFVGFYQIDGDNNPLVYQPVDIETVPNGEFSFYAFYVYGDDIMDILERYKTAEQYILSGDKYEIRITPNVQQEIYYQGELLYLVDFVNQNTYYKMGMTFYKTVLYDEIINIPELINGLNRDDFWFYVDGEYLLTYPPERVHTFKINAGNGSLTFESNYMRPIQVFIFSAESFTPYNKEDISYVQDVVSQVKPEVNYYDVIDVLDAPTEVDMHVYFESGIERYFYWDEFMTRFSGHFEAVERRVYYTIAGIERYIQLGGSYVDIYDKSHDAVIIFPFLETFFYLGSMVAMPSIGYHSFVNYYKWYDGDPTTAITLGYLQDKYSVGDVVNIGIAFDYMSLSEINQFFENSTSIIIDFHISSGETGYYNYLKDKFEIFDINGNSVTIAFELDNTVSIYNNEFNINFPALTYEIKLLNTPNLFGFADLSRIVNIAIHLRDILKGNQAVVDSWSDGYRFADDTVLNISPDNVIIYNLDILYTVWIRLSNHNIVTQPASNYSYAFWVVDFNDLSNFMVKTNNPHLLTKVNLRRKGYDYFIKNYYYNIIGDYPDYSQPYNPDVVLPGTYALFIDY